MASVSSVSYSGNLDIDGILSGVRWSDPYAWMRDPGFPVNCPEARPSSPTCAPMAARTSTAVLDTQR